MNIERLKKKTLTELLELKTATEAVCDDYAKKLTNYATMSADPMFQKMDSSTKQSYENRGKMVSSLGGINKVIEDRLMDIYYE